MTGKISGRRRNAQGALFVISALLVGSGLVRLGDGTGLAVAREVGELAQSGAGDHAPSPACVAGDAPAALLTALQGRERRIAEREAALDERQRTVELAAEEVAGQIAALEQAEERLRATVALADEAAEGDLARLTTVYENMKPKEAARLFEAMEPEFAAGFLGRMRPDVAAAVMAGLTPSAAYSISVILAGRNVGVPTE